MIAADVSNAANLYGCHRQDDEGHKEKHFLLRRRTTAR